MSKPRGKISKQGHIYHSSSEYTQWNNKFIQGCREAKFNPPQSFYTMCFVFNGQPKKGRSQDCDNLTGACLDALVKGKYLSDDNINVVNSFFSKYIKSPVDFVSIYFCESKRDFIYFVEKYA